jgi:hypothetical protein
MSSSGIGGGVGLALCWCFDVCEFWPKTAAENRKNKITKTNKNERFMAVPGVPRAL